MKVIYFSSNLDTLDEWKKRAKTHEYLLCYDIVSLHELTQKFEDKLIIVADFDSVAQDINKLIISNNVPKKMIVLEKTPEIVSGKMLISHGIKAYGNSRMLYLHYKQMLSAVTNGDVWTYPELTAALAKYEDTLSQDTKELLERRLTEKEIAVVYAILEGLTNDAIAQKLEITTRTVKAHVSSIFSKLHVNDRVSLVLLLK